MENKNKTEWYDNPDVLTNIILITAIIIIVMSQSMAVNSEVSGLIMLKNLLNHNITYIAAVVYFIFLKTKIGRRNFNLINAIYICLYVLNVVASIFTIFQSFGLASIMAFVLNTFILGYMCYTFLPETRIWQDFNLNKLPFDEIKNEWCFYGICIVALILLLINLINVSNFEGIVLTLFDTIYILLFSRYIFLYKYFVDSNNKLLESNQQNTSKLPEKSSSEDVNTTDSKVKKNSDEKDDKKNSKKGKGKKNRKSSTGKEDNHE